MFHYAFERAIDTLCTIGWWCSRCRHISCTRYTLAGATRYHAGQTKSHIHTHASQNNDFRATCLNTRPLDWCWDIGDDAFSVVAAICRRAIMPHQITDDYDIISRHCRSYSTLHYTFLRCCGAMSLVAHRYNLSDATRAFQESLVEAIIICEYVENTLQRAFIDIMIISSSQIGCTSPPTWYFLLSPR